ncbi:vacuolar protein 8 [Vigna unguiculata]|uniref:Vacuolar protein 8 n=1 Tax=Vigna unguiculata TaxID=3917 RepID=A0A4D6NWU2_VIGUN|nr:vacuolar protein 8 [Vigna unguiculata]
MSSIVKEILASPIQLADQVSKMAEEAQNFRQECLELKSKTEKLAGLLRQAARNSSDLYERPTRRIIDDTEQVLDKALVLVTKCRANSVIKRLFTIIPATAFRKTSMQLENSVGDVQWLLRVSASADERDDEYLGLPPIAANEPILCLIWEQVAILLSGASLDERSDAAASLVSLARDNDRYGRLIIEEGGVPPLLKLLKEGHLEGQENAARAIGLLGKDPESVEHIVNAGVCSVFAKILKDGHMKVQAVVAWAISELAANHPKCQDHFSQNNAIRLLVSHLAFETIQEHSKYAIANKHKSLHTLVLESNNTQEEEDDKNVVGRPTGANTSNQMHNVVSNTMAMKGITPKNNATPTGNHNNTGGGTNTKKHHGGTQHVSIAGTSIKGREYEDPITKIEMKAMAARALWQLARGNLSVCRSITESRALLCFAVLLEKGPEDVQSYSAMALMEITAVSEQHAELRRSAFKPTAPAAKAVLDQLLRVIENEQIDLLVPCIRSVGNLARTFRATETRLIGPLVRLLDEREAHVSTEAAIALNKFACTDNYLHENHCNAIIEAGGAKHLIQLVYFGEQMVQIPSVTLLCYIALHVPKSETLAQEEVLIVLEWCTKQAHLVEEHGIIQLLPEAKSRLELYQSRGRGFR